MGTVDETVVAARDGRGEITDDARSATESVRATVEDAVGRVPDLPAIAQWGIGQLAEQVPEAAKRARLGIRVTANTLQRLPDTTLRLMSAGSIGLAAGLRLAGAPRILAIGAAAPAVIMGGAIAARPRSDARARSKPVPEKIAPEANASA